MTRTFIFATLLLTPLAALRAAETTAEHFAALTAAARLANTKEEPVASGKFQPTWESLHQYEFPEWYRDAKFGIWAHWGVQGMPEKGEWYARNMYVETEKSGKPGEIWAYHREHYGHQSVFGFKDIIPLWKAEKWNPSALVALYKKSGAKYFMALANHHDNFDNWESQYQPWNSVNLGPHQDLIAGWAKAAKEQGLPFGVSVHAARAWGWNGFALGSDKTGPKVGIPYDGHLTAADGKGLWWEGLDPQIDLYAQNHGPKDKPSADYMRKFYNRTMDLINRYHPELLYFDDDISRGLPLYGDDPSVGLRIAAHYYNDNLAQHGGRLTGLIAAKKLSEERKQCLLYDIERGSADEILPEPWQTDTCIANWQYNRARYDGHGYRKPSDIIPMLADIVSKNGNLMLNIPVREDGTIDDQEVHILNEIGGWLQTNGAAIYATRPWKIFGESPPVTGGTTGDRKFTAQDIRFTTAKDGRTLYAIVLGVPSQPVHIKSLARENISSVTLLGSDSKLDWKQDAEALVIKPLNLWPCQYAVVFVMKLAK